MIQRDGDGRVAHLGLCISEASPSASPMHNLSINLPLSDAT